MPKAGVTDVQLQANLDYACGKGGIDCGPIQPGGACFEPNTLLSHATYAMNLLYQTNGKHAWDCDFSKTATLSSKNPSKLSLFKLSFLLCTSFAFCSTIDALSLITLCSCRLQWLHLALVAARILQNRRSNMSTKIKLKVVFDAFSYIYWFRHLLSFRRGKIFYFCFFFLCDLFFIDRGIMLCSQCL